ncbi:MAG: DUF547 domain-containing protein [Hyphomicrobium sp.]
MLTRRQGLKTIAASGLLVLTAMPVRAAVLDETFATFKADSDVAIDHSAWSKLLATYVVASPDAINRVRYADFKRDGYARLKQYIKDLEAVEVSSLARREQMAFWANLYNAKTIDIVLDAYPVKSIKDISLGGGLLAVVTGGPWKAKVVTIAGARLSLDDIEHGILRPVFKDPRVHYAVNCASIGCPNIMREAFNATTLDAQLDAGARAYVNHRRGFAVTGGGLTASSIYDWFASDFGDEAGVLAHARTYAAPPLKQKLERISEISGYDYDWSLNEAPR